MKELGVKEEEIEFETPEEKAAEKKRAGEVAGGGEAAAEPVDVE